MHTVVPISTILTQAVAEAGCKDLTLVWGPPGTGKTTTIIHIINQWIGSAKEAEHILVAASTNNALDNVLEKFLSARGDPTDIVRVCPDNSSLSKTAQRFWVGAFVEVDINKPSASMKDAQKKVADAKSFSPRALAQR